MYIFLNFISLQKVSKFQVFKISENEYETVRKHRIGIKITLLLSIILLVIDRSDISHIYFLTCKMKLRISYLLKNNQYVKYFKFPTGK